MPRLSADQIATLRRDLPEDVEAVAFHEGTERPGSSPLNAEKRAGVYHCAVCDAPLFASETKYESGSGWPSFYAPVADDAFETKTDFHLLVPRTEFHCANCGAHGGHVFPDGPPPTGRRWCANGTVLRFKPA
ncbi:peptide-methionine (R)-S-oxide reductase MsrB [Glycocaulis profundi]|nr:peptide-methionine (R)-S-oxide reductase MsrB [Glycocaulis profundi]